MNKAELVEKLYAKRGDDIKTKAAAERIVSDVFDLVVEGTCKDGEARFAGFGTLKIAQRSARNGVDPQTGEKIKIKAKKVAKFVPAKDFKEKAAKSKA